MNPESAAAERYRGESLQILERVPAFARRILMVGGQRGETGALLRRRPGVQVYALESDPEFAAVATHILDGVAQDTTALKSLLGETPIDVLLIMDDFSTAEAFGKIIAQLSPMLSPNAHIYVRMPAPNSDLAAMDAITEVAVGQGLLVYRSYTEGAPDDKPLDAALEASRRKLGIFVFSKYDPVMHARDLDASGHPDWAYHLLSDLPESLFSSSSIIGELRAEALLCLLNWLRQSPDIDVLDYFDQIQKYFYQGSYHNPTLPPLYQIQAEFWLLLGDAIVARGLLESIQQVAPTDSVARQLTAMPTVEVQSHGTVEAVPEYSPHTSPKRILFVTHPRFHYGLDVLYNGLCQQLGDENVVDFPYKPTLHGASTEAFKNYPCSFNHGGPDMGLDEVLAQLHAGLFDAVLYGDCESGLMPDTATALIQAAGNTPIFLIDEIDEALDMRKHLSQLYGYDGWAGYLKRECLACHDYGPNTFPAPFAYADDRASQEPNFDREPSLFWAGHRMYGGRRIFLDHIESRLGLDLSADYSPEAYMEQLKTCQVGLNLFGFGFDTVRFWEIPAHGALLLSQHLPIRIPYPFEDGKTALFFNTVNELEEKIRYCMAHPDEARSIAEAGHRHFMEHHSASARARQILGFIRNAFRRLRASDYL